MAWMNGDDETIDDVKVGIHDADDDFQACLRFFTLTLGDLA